MRLTGVLLWLRHSTNQPGIAPPDVESPFLLHGGGDGIAPTHPHGVWFTQLHQNSRHRVWHTPSWGNQGTLMYASEDYWPNCLKARDARAMLLWCPSTEWGGVMLVNRAPTQVGYLWSMFWNQVVGTGAPDAVTHKGTALFPLTFIFNHITLPDSKMRSWKSR